MASFVDPYDGGNLIKFDDGSGDIIIEREAYVMPSLTPSAVHTVMEGDTLQSIAFQYYGDSGNWVAIADINNIGFQYRELEEGMQIVIP